MVVVSINFAKIEEISIRYASIIVYSGVFSRGVYFMNFEITVIHGINFLSSVYCIYACTCTCIMYMHIINNSRNTCT